MIFLIVQGLSAGYLIFGSLIITADKNLASKVFFKVVPMLLGLPLAFDVFAKIMGWPV